MCDLEKSQVVNLKLVLWNLLDDGVRRENVAADDASTRMNQQGTCCSHASGFNKFQQSPGPGAILEGCVSCDILGACRGADQPPIIDEFLRGSTRWQCGPQVQLNIMKLIGQGS